MAIPKFKDRAKPNETKGNLKIQSDLSCGLPWALKHSPQNLDELAMHPSKLNDLYKVLAPETDTRVLVLSGPAGSSKSTCIRLIARERGQSILEFHAPEALVGSTTLVNSFHEFMVGAAMYDRRKTIVLVEELPSLFHEETRKAFEESLVQWSQEPGQPIAAIAFTEIEVSAKYNEAIVVPRVLGQLINGLSTSNGGVVWLKTNAINVTLLQKHLKSVAKKEGCDVPLSIIKTLAQCGDIRSALNALEFYCRAPNNTNNVSASDLWVRGTPAELFYAIGKVIWTSSKQGSLEESLAMFEDSMDTFNLTVLENYTSAKHQRLPIDAAAEVTEWLSIADTCQPSISLGPLGAAKAIADSDERTDQPKRFVQTRFTQFPKWQSERFSQQSRFLRSLRNMRQSAVLTGQAVLLDERAFTKYFPPKNTSEIMDDESDDDDDDF